MPFGQNQSLVTFKAAADLSSYQYCFVYMSAADTVSYSTANEKTIGILQNKPDAAGKEAIVATPGSISQLVVNEACARGKYLTSTATGKGEIADAAGEHVGAQALEAATAQNDRIAVLVTAFEAYDSDA